MKPPRVRAGDTVAVVSPGFGAVGRWPHRLERGVAYLEGLGLRVKLMENARRSEGWASAPPEARVADLHAAFLDDEVSVVLCGIGGNHANQLLPLLDFELIAAHPKLFQGFSDMTVLHWALWRHAGLGGFHGPMLVSELGEFPEVLPETDSSLRAAWFGDEPLRYGPAAAWTDEFLDWDAQLDLRRHRLLEPGEGWVALRGGRAEGWLLGGCLETICWHLKGSTSWVEPDGAILFLETSEEAPSPAEVDGYLTDLEQLGVFDAAAALVVGRPYGYDEERRKQLHELVVARTEASGIPVLANVDIGHTDPMLTLPLGCRAGLDVDALRFETLEPATARTD
ncbi:MAG: muramoyltetrapeptide carboxypeptidase [Gaiellaceae bacterium]|nr:muramoyltetrapeptide carboxypeptidase [Gaiellaceae bacterium]